jgi:hypothetical protein
MRYAVPVQNVVFPLCCLRIRHQEQRGSNVLYWNGIPNNTGKQIKLNTLPYEIGAGYHCPRNLRTTEKKNDDESLGIVIRTLSESVLPKPEPELP